ncbi:MAG TPA: twin-arginine translocase TatA/TatE family subunit [Thermopetrobacter sp.]|nr:twin-arginine translocase TatA/TatE family subunit [Thermopetrobacter sp.]
MGAFSIWHWLIVLAVVLILFGGSGKISSLMGDVAKGIKSFRKGLQDADDTDEASTQALEDKAAGKVENAENTASKSRQG